MLQHHIATTDHRLIPINSIECNLALCILETNEPQMIENLWELLITSINHRLELDGELPTNRLNISRFVGPVFSAPIEEDTIYG